MTRNHINTGAFQYPFVYGIQTPKSWLHHRLRGLEFFLREGRLPTWLRLKDYHFSRALDSYGVQVVHVHFLYYALDILDSLCKVDLPVVVTVHGEDVHRARVDQEYRRRLGRLFERADRIVAVSDFIRNTLVSVGCPVEKIVRIYLGCPVPSACADPGVVRGRVRLLCVASLKPVKGHGFLIEAVRLALASGADVELRIIGDGEMKPHLEAQIRASGLADRVKLLGWLPPNLVRRRLLDAEVYVQHSVRLKYIGLGGRPWLTEEGLPISLVEASAAGLPIIATRSGGIPEICRDGLNGFVVDEEDVEAFADRIVTLARDPALRSTLGSAGRALVLRQFDQSKQLSRLEALYDSLLSVNLPSAPRE